MEFYPVTTIQECLKCESKGIGAIRAQIGEESIIAAIALLLTDLVKFFNLGKTMNSYQLAETAKLILKEFYWLKIEDLRIFFERMKTGFYGQMFDRIDGQVIMIHLRDYCEERITVKETINIEQTKGEQKECYVLKVEGGKYIKRIDEGFEEVEKKYAERFEDFKICLDLCKLFRNQFGLDLRIESPNLLSEIMSKLIKDNPELVSKEEKFKRATEGYNEKKRKIMSDENLSEFEKENAVRKLANLQPLSEYEFNERKAN